MGPAEEFYEHIFTTTAQGIFQSTPRGRYLRVNAAMAKIYGYATPDEMIKSVKKHCPADLYARPEARAQFKKLLEENDVIENFEAQNKRKDGTVIWTSADARECEMLQVRCYITRVLFGILQLINR